MSTTEKLDTKVITGEVRLSYAHLWEPATAPGSTEPKYSVSLLIPKKDKVTLTKINKAIELIKNSDAAKTKWGGKVPSNLKLPLRDGDVDRPDDDNYAGHFFINANAKTKPGIVDIKAMPIMNQDEVYSGCFGRASITFYAYNSNGSKGIAAGLNHIMKTKEGDPLGGRSTAESDFAEVLNSDDDMLS